MVSPLGTARRGLPVHAVLAVLLCVALPVAFGAYDTTFPFGRCSSGPSPYRVEPIVTQPQQQQGGKAGATAGARTFCFKLLARRPTQGSCSDYCCKEAGVHKLEINVKPQCYVSGDVVSATLNGKPTKAAAGLRRTTNTPPGMNATVLAVTQLGLPGIAAVDGAQVCITLATNKDRRGCTTLEDLCVPPAGQPAGTCAVALFDATIRCCPTSSARLLAGSRPGTSAAPSPPPRPPPPPSPRTNCPPKAGYTLLVDTNWEGLPGWKGGQEASGEAAHKLCDADPQCGHWNNWGYWFNGAAKSYFEYGGLCSYVKNGKEMYNTRVSNFFCGEAAAAVGTYITTSDAPLAALMPPAAIAGRAGFILEQVTTSYLHGWNSNYTGPVHGGYAGVSGTRAVDLAAPGLQVTAVRTCCAGGSWGNGAQTVQLRVADAAAKGKGSSKVLYAGSDSWCSTPQDWVPVPPGYRFAGVKTQTKAGSADNYVHRIAFVFASIKPKS